MHKGNSRAFTLAELLMAVLVISIIMVALAPVITKRVIDNVGLISSGSEGKLFLYDPNNASCKPAADDLNSLDCTFIAPEGVHSVSVVMVSGGGGGGGATTPTVLLNQKKAAGISSSIEEIPLTQAIKNVRISYLSGGGGGGGAGNYGETFGPPSSQADCDPYNALYIPQSSRNDSLCFTKYNAGDALGPQLAGGVHNLSSGVACPAGVNNCCWKGATSRSCTESGSWGSHNSNYSGCDRTVCHWQAAYDSCSQWTPDKATAGKWRLPEGYEFDVFASSGYYNINLGSDGVQFCDAYSSTSGLIECGPSQNGCPSIGRYNSVCQPAYLWSATYDNYMGSASPDYTGSDSYMVYYFHYGTFDYSSMHRSEDGGASTRCVLSDSFKHYNTFSGGGGSGAPYLKNLHIRDEYISDNIGGEIALVAGAGGKGGSTSSKDGKDGNESYIYIYDKNGAVKQGYKVSGGYGGSGAKTDGFGIGGSIDTSTSMSLEDRYRYACQEENGPNSWYPATCSHYGYAGGDGQKASGTEITARGGQGGGSMYGGVSAGGGLGGASLRNPEEKNGQKGETYGAGGGGGSVKFGTSGSTINTQKATGGAGANGIAEILYDEYLQAAAGGGGGGGAFAKVKNIPVTPGQTYTIRVGAGGSGGAVSINGSNGGETSVVFADKTYKLSGGGGGAAGVSATQSSLAAQGVGGSGGIVYSNVSDKSNLEHKNGEAGTNAQSFEGSSVGGIGGTSGILTKGGCGGLFIDSAICTNTNAGGLSVKFVTPGNIIQNNDYGSAGAGGGGGGWNIDELSHPEPGGGGSGQNGYVYIYWTKN